MDRKLIDGFTFYNELDMLEFRLKELDSIVDKFIIVEATKTHQGNDKPLFFDDNKNKFSKYKDKIVHIVVDDMPEGDDNWKRENHQRNAISNGLDKLNDTDLVIIGDVDEIPDTNTLKHLKENGLDSSVALEMDFYYYNLENKHNQKWYLAKVLPYGELRKSNPQDIRFSKSGTKDTLDKIEHKIQSNGGWHFSYFGDENMIINKIKNFAHSEYNEDTYLNSVVIKGCIEDGDDILFRGIKLQQIKIEDNNYIPKYYKMLEVI